MKPLTIALAVGTALVMTSCVNRAENKTTNIFNIDSPRDMAVTLYYDVEKPTVEFITPSGTKVSADDLLTDRKGGAVCYHIANAAPGQWQMAYDKINKGELEVNWASEF